MVYYEGVKYKYIDLVSSPHMYVIRMIIFVASNADEYFYIFTFDLDCIGPAMHTHRKQLNIII